MAERPQRRSSALRRRRPAATPEAWLEAILLAGAALGLAALLRRAITLPDVEMLFLLAVTVTAVRRGLGPALLASALGVLAYDYFFVEPLYTFDVSDGPYLITFAMMFAVGAAMGTLTERLRREREEAERREAQASAQHRLAAALAAAGDTRAVAAAAVRFAADALGGGAAVLVPVAGGEPEVVAEEGAIAREPARRWARAALSSGRPAGAPDGVACLPLLAGMTPVAVLALAPWPEPDLDPEQVPLVEGLRRQVASALERVRLGEEARASALRAEAEAQRSALLSAVSHDLRTPLAVITGSATELRDDPGLDEAARRELLDTVCEEADRLERLVADLLDMTRLQAGVAPRREWLPLEEVVGEALARSARRLGDRPVRVELGGAPLVHADPLLLGQLLQNLLDNAAKYTPPGTPVAVTAAPAGGGVAIEVSDRGPGLPPGAEERVFERFERGPHPGVAGAGLGLAIARAIAEVHGGTLTALQAPGGGACFRLTLPAPAEPPPARPGGEDAP